MKAKTKIEVIGFVPKKTVHIDLTNYRHCEFQYDDVDLAQEHYLYLEATSILMGQVIKKIWME